jgi:hypothetical protein
MTNNMAVILYPSNGDKLYFETGKGDITKITINGSNDVIIYYKEGGYDLYHNIPFCFRIGVIK